MAAEDTDPLPSRRQFYEVTASCLSTCPRSLFWRQVDAAITLGLSACARNEWLIYAELHFDRISFLVIQDKSSELADTFNHEKTRILNVERLMGGSERTEDAYLETQEEVFEHDYVDEIQSSLDYFKRIRYGVPSEFVRILANDAASLMLSAADAADLPLMSESNYDAEGKNRRQETVLPIFAAAFAQLINTIRVTIEADDSQFEVSALEVREKSSSFQLIGLAEVIKRQYQTFTSEDPIGQRQLADMAERVGEAVKRVDLPHCSQVAIGRFVDGEMDSDTPGMRGPGRSIEHPPRFAAQHRQAMINSSQNERDAVRMKIENHILCGYAFAEIVLEVSDRCTQLPTARDLYENMWMQIIHSPMLDMWDLMTNSDKKCADMWHGATAEELHDILLSMGGDWSETDLAIATFYFHGGMKLRVLEARPLTELESRDAATGGGYSLFVGNRQMRNPEKSGCMGVCLVFMTAISSVLFLVLQQIL